MVRPSLLLALTGAVVFAGIANGSAGASPREITVDPAGFRVIARQSGKVNYYTLVEGADPHIHAAYRPPTATAVLGYEIPDALRHRVAQVRWKWRADTLPRGGDECRDGKGDSAAVVYLTWRRGLKWYSVKYVWSAVGPRGKTCDVKRNLFRAQDTVVVDSGPPLDEWHTVRVDPDTEFRNHFEGGDARAEVPDLIGIGIMTDGDQTNSESAADFGGFSLMTR